jgi:quinol monooxygenase YgiN
LRAKRDALAAILLESTHTMPGCLSYIIATDPAEPDALWVTEVGDNPASHQASMAQPVAR